MSPDDAPKTPTIGPYPIVRQLGQGGMGVVYLVEDSSAGGRHVALKLQRNESGDPRMTERFLREAKVLAALQHPGVVKIHSTGWLNEGPFLLMDYVEGRPLDELREPMDPREAARITREVADAVAAMHAQGLLHRDLKPSNVIMRPDGSPVLLDFGLARDLRDDRMTRTGEVLGTPSFMSPEQADGGDPGAFGPPVDVYGLAALMFQLLTARAPYIGSSVRIVLDILEMPPPLPSSQTSGIPRALDAIFQKATRRDPAARYPDAAGLRDDLDRFLAGDPPEALTGFRSIGRRRLIRAAVALTLAVSVVGAGWAIAQRPSEAQIEQAPPRLRDVKTTVTQGLVTVSGSVRTKAEFAELRLGEHSARAKNGESFELTATVEPGVRALELGVFGPDGAAGKPRSLNVGAAWPSWFVALEPADRPPLPLPPGLLAAESSLDYRWAKDGSLLRWIPPGTFDMGMTSKEIWDGGAMATRAQRESWTGAKAVKVRLTRGLFLGRFEVTWEQWDQFCQATGRERAPRTYDRRPKRKKNFQIKWRKGEPVTLREANHPASRITYDDALAYCAWAGLRLPTEAEWERAARGGKDDQVYLWGDEFVRTATNGWGADGFEFTSPVGQFPEDRSGYGCYDMAGNVSEVVSDFFHPHPEGVAILEDPAYTEPGESGKRSLRGGSWGWDLAHVFQLSYRAKTRPDQVDDRVGFRVALSPSTGR